MIAGANLFGKEASGRNLVKLEASGRGVFFFFGGIFRPKAGWIQSFFLFETLESKLDTL